MPESNSKNKRKKRVRLVSLRTRTLKITLIGALVLSTVAFVVGLMLYAQELHGYGLFLSREDIRDRK